MQNHPTQYVQHETDTRWVVSAASAEIEPQGRKRPWPVWVIAVVTSLPVVFSLVSLVFIKFVMDDSVASRVYADWTLEDYLFAHYPAATIIVGVILVIRMSRWAFVPYAFIFLRATYNLVFHTPKIPDSEYQWVFWVPSLMILGIYAFATGYGLLLWRRAR